MKPKETDFKPQTLGQHIRKRRLEFGLTQQQLGDRLGVTSFTILNWEYGYTQALLQCMPRIISFLGYDPFPVPHSLAERLLAKRRRHGWSIAEASKHLSVDEGTWAAWEGGGTILKKHHRAAVATFLGLKPASTDAAVAQQWDQIYRRRKR